MPGVSIIFLELKRDTQIVVVDFPDASPMLPCTFAETVVERQRHGIDANIGRALHVVMAADDVGASSRLADVAGANSNMQLARTFAVPTV